MKQHLSSDDDHSDSAHELKRDSPDAGSEQGIVQPFQDNSAAPVLDPDVISRKPKGGLVMASIAWILILVIAIFQLLEPYLFAKKDDEKSSKINVTMLELTGKYIVGSAQIGVLSDEEAANQIAGMDSGPLEHRFCHAILLNELDSASTASEHMSELRQLVADNAYEMTAEQEQMFGSLENLFADYENEAWESPSVQQIHRDLLVTNLGWFGQLAFAVENGPNQVARQQLTSKASATTWFLVAVTLVGVLVFMLGFAGFIAAIVLVAAGRVQMHTENYCGNGRIYIEAFAVWFVLFVALQIGAGLLLVFGFVPKGLLLPLLLLTTFTSLISLAWPLLRGVSWSEVRQDLGLKCNNVFVEIFLGLISYACCLPILIGGFVVTAVLMASFGPAQDANNLDADPISHPAIEWITSNGIWGYVFVALMTVVSAPIVEETVFRGMMYRHLRDASHRWGRWLSVLFAATVNALIFAAIHPQGIFAIPVLAALAFSFTLVREWRGSLFAPMTMHALHNGMITSVWIIALT